MDDRLKWRRAGGIILVIAGFFFFHEGLARFVVGLILTAYGLVGATRRRIVTFVKLKGFVAESGLSAVIEGLLFAAMGSILALIQARALWPSFFASRH